MSVDGGLGEDSVLAMMQHSESHNGLTFRLEDILAFTYNHSLAIFLTNEMGSATPIASTLEAITPSVRRCFI